MAEKMNIIEIKNIGFEPLLTDKEYIINAELYELKEKLKCYKHSINILNSMLSKNHLTEDNKNEYKWVKNNINIIQNAIDEIKIDINHLKEELKKEMIFNIKNNTIRELKEDRIFLYDEQLRNIHTFESDLTRKCNIEPNTFSDKIVSVTTYYTEIFKSIILNGFLWNEEHYSFFTAGAGQTRNKKSTFVKTAVLKEIENSLFCGLNKEIINELGGMNTNKYLAYTSLSQSSSSIWSDFDIDRAIVVEDIEFIIPNQKVRSIHTQTLEEKEQMESIKAGIKDIDDQLKKINENKKHYSKIKQKREKEEIKLEKELKERKNELKNTFCEIENKLHSMNICYEDVKIPFTDGFGIMFKKGSFMARLPFIKGLMSYFPKSKFINYCKKNKIKINKVIDIYGKEYDLKDIDYVFTKSQFKMYKYYNNVFNNNGELIKTGWEVYKDNFKKYNCTACRCNIEEDVKLNAKTNYQILQTLTTEMTDEDIYSLIKYDADNLNGIGENIQCALNILGANPDKNPKMSYLQKALYIYPEMLQDPFIKKMLSDTKQSMIKKIKSGKFNINGAYTFAIPDTFACMQWWFNGERDINKLGLLKEGEVYCSLFDDNEEIDCLRSPHLDHAHCIRKNLNTKELKSWFPTKGVYIAVEEIMSKLLMYDNDGDKLLVHNNEIIIKCAKSFQKKYGMFPNYFDMPKAKSEMLTNETLFNGINSAYHHGNIGTPSNEITKIWSTLNLNSTEKEIRKALDIIALRCADVNFTIDYAKTLFKPDIPSKVLDEYKKYSGLKVPYFFKYAKNKYNNQIEKKGKCNIDRIDNLVSLKRIKYKELLKEKYNYKKFMNNPDVNIDLKTEENRHIISLFKEIQTNHSKEINSLNIPFKNFEQKKLSYIIEESNIIKKKNDFINLIDNRDEDYVMDLLIKALRNESTKSLLWGMFGEKMYSNLEKRVSGTKICSKCKKRYVPNSNNQKMCNSCKVEK